MKKSLKLLVLPAAILLAASTLTSCNPGGNIEIAMISDVGDIDDGGFNQGCWQAVKDYGRDHNKQYDYYRPFADSDFARKCSVRQAIAKGAKIIILPGFKFGDTAAQMANENKETKFVLIDAPVENPPKNLISVTYDFAVSGWLAGYAVCKDYFTFDYQTDGKLKDNYGFGYFGGMSNPGVYPVGFGYIQGILYAAQAFVLENKITNLPFINIEYDYAGVFMQDDMACIICKGWLTNSDPKYNTKVIFACGGKLYQSVTEAVGYYNEHFLPQNERNFEDQNAPRNAARWIGVDGDQYNLLKEQKPDDIKSIITSGLKDVGQTVKVSLDYYFNNAWDDIVNNNINLGLNSRFVANENKHEFDPIYSYVGIPDHENDKKVLTGFKTFTNEDLNNAKKIITQAVEPSFKIYSGMSKEFGEEEGMPSCFNTEKYFKSEYNKQQFKEQAHENDKYPLDRYIVHTPEPKK